MPRAPAIELFAAAFPIPVGACEEVPLAAEFFVGAVRDKTGAVGAAGGLFLQPIDARRLADSRIEIGVKTVALLMWIEYGIVFIANRPVCCAPSGIECSAARA